MPLPSKRDPDAVRPRLAAWLATQLPAGAAPEVGALTVPSGTGMSSETFLFDAAWTVGGRREEGGFVVRMRPQMDDFPVFPTYDLALQYRCLTTVGAHTDVPVPRARWLELDARPLGDPFFVMERIDGTAPPDVPPYLFGSWVTEGGAAERARLQRNAVDVLARLHTVAPGQVDLAFLDRPAFGATALDQHLNYYRWYYDWARGDLRYPIIERTFAWLDAHRPADPGPTVLNWGDARIGNMLFRDWTPVAVLDWEMAALGPREADLAWMIFLHDFFVDLADRMAGGNPIPDFMRREDVLATYEAATGHVPRHVDFWEVFGALRFAVISTRTSARAIAYGDLPKPDDPEDLVMHRGMLERMLSGEYWRR